VQLLRSRWPSSAAHIHDDGPATLLSGVLQAAQRAEGFERSAMRLSRSARYGLMKHTKPKKRPRRWNSTLPVTESKPRKRSPVKKKNPARIKKRREEAFGNAVNGRAAFIRGCSCVLLVRALKRGGMIDENPIATVIRAGCNGPVEAAHTKSRGAGGKSKHLIPLCRAHHTEQHLLGIKTFAMKHGLDLKHEAELYETMWISGHSKGEA
jgi:hypothetical protein